MELDLGTLKLRPLRETDAASLARHGNDRDVWLNLRDAFPHPYTEENAREFVARVSDSDALVLGLEVGGEVVGVCGVYPQDDVYRRSAEVGYWVARAHQGRGLATRAVKALSEQAFETLDLVRLYAEVFGGNEVVPGNTASARVLEKCGYQREGVLRASVFKDGQLLDSWLYALVRR